VEDPRRRPSSLVIDRHPDTGHPVSGIPGALLGGGCFGFRSILRDDRTGVCGRGLGRRPEPGTAAPRIECPSRACHPDRQPGWPPREGSRGSIRLLPRSLRQWIRGSPGPWRRSSISNLPLTASAFLCWSFLEEKMVMSGGNHGEIGSVSTGWQPFIGYGHDRNASRFYGRGLKTMKAMNHETRGLLPSSTLDILRYLFLA